MGRERTEKGKAFSRSAEEIGRDEEAAGGEPLYTGLWALHNRLRKGWMRDEIKKVDAGDGGVFAVPVPCGVRKESPGCGHTADPCAHSNGHAGADR